MVYTYGLYWRIVGPACVISDTFEQRNVHKEPTTDFSRVQTKIWNVLQISW